MVIRPKWGGGAKWGYNTALTPFRTNYVGLVVCGSNQNFLLAECSGDAVDISERHKWKHPQLGQVALFITFYELLSETTIS